eukprot:scaffold485451_cov19-Prasinocladus_malaysianus.AAC.1
MAIAYAMQIKITSLNEGFRSRTKEHYNIQANKKQGSKVDENQCTACINATASLRANRVQWGKERHQ